MYARTLAKKEETVLKIWRLINNDDYSWELFCGKSAFQLPVTMHPWQCIHLMSLLFIYGVQLVSCNLLKQDYTVLGDACI